MEQLSARAPDYLDKVSANLYRKTVKSLAKNQYLEKTDQPLLEAYTTNYSLMLQAWQSIQEIGITYTSNDGRVYANPAVKQFDTAQKQFDTAQKQFDTAQKQFKSLANELCITPISRPNQL